MEKTKVFRHVIKVPNVIYASRWYCDEAEAKTAGEAAMRDALFSQGVLRIDQADLPLNEIELGMLALGTLIQRAPLE